jgi:dienelactone hydrolase
VPDTPETSDRRATTQTIVPDYLNGDPYPEDFGAPGKVFDRDGWKPRHTRAETRPPLDRAIAGLKEQGITQLATTGYCFGARYAVDLAVENVSKVAPALVGPRPAALKQSL